MHKARPVCQAVTAGEFPAAVAQPVQYSPRTQAVAVYLQTYQLLSYERMAEALHDLFGVRLSEGTWANAQATTYAIPGPVEQVIVAAIQQADVVPVDETGQRVGGRPEWFYTLSMALLTFYAHHAKRGQEAIGVLLGCLGRQVHDAWAPYLTLPGRSALCNAHLLRELIGLCEDTGQAWVQKLIRLLMSMRAMIDTARAAGQTELPARQRAGFTAAFMRFLKEGLPANPPPRPTSQRGRPKQTPARNLLNRLITQRDAILALPHDSRVPFDNNQAERDLRMLKVRSQVCGLDCRSAGGRPGVAADNERARSSSSCTSYQT
ncbi:MAG: IS66 family transposase [Anaerolineales bacterium]|nr:IS66 family transposase [Anaerolineales bacterium]